MSNLWFDDEFLVKRHKEQELYLIELEERLLLGILSPERYNELKDSALFIKERIEHQLKRPHPIEVKYDREEH
jgi:hypothetical protein